MKNYQRNSLFFMAFVFGVVQLSCTRETNVDAITPNYNYTCNYFIDAMTGDDSNDGRSPETAWKTADRVTEYSRATGYIAGDAICFKRGQRFVITNGLLGTGSSGSSGYRFVYYGAYGDSALPKPILSTSLKIDTLDDWKDEVGFLTTGPADWELVSGTTYIWPNYHGSWQASGFWEDTVPLEKAASIAVGPGEWFFNTDISQGDIGLYYSPSDDQHPNTHQLYFAKKSTIFFNQSTNVVFSDLQFEYAGIGIISNVNTDSPVAVHDYAVVNSNFYYMTIAIEVRSERINGVAYEPKNLAFIGNSFSDNKFSIRLQSNNSELGFSNVLITENVIRNTAVGGAYFDNAGDIEAITIQNPSATIISDNDIRSGLKAKDGVPNNSTPGDAFSIAIIGWRHNDVVLSNISINRNFIQNMGYGIVIGAGPFDMMRDIEVSNNILSENEVGIAALGEDQSGNFHVSFNTLYKNNVNLDLSPLRGHTIVGNLSVLPTDYHVRTTGGTGDNIFNYNGYIPDGEFLLVGGGGNADVVYISVESWRQSVFAKDSMSLTSSEQVFENMLPVEPEDYKLNRESSAIDYVYNPVHSGDKDFSGSTRLVGPALDIGALEFQ